MRLVKRAVFARGFRKYLFESRGAAFEASLHPLEEGFSVHVSTQVGCAMGCTFCATSRLGYVRDLVKEEIAGQVFAVTAESGIEPCVCSASAQGEPLENIDEVLSAFEMVRERCPDVAFEVSTCGCVAGIRRLADEAPGCSLVVTLHSARQEKRDRLMPGVAQWPLNALRKVLESRAHAFSNVCIDVALIPGVNDTAGDADALAAWCAGLPCDVRIMPMLPLSGGSARIEEPGLNRFAKRLRASGLRVEVLPPLPDRPLSIKTFPATRS